MGIYTRKYKLKYSDIGINNHLNLKSLIDYLQEVAGEHSASVRLWFEWYSKNSYCLACIGLEIKNVFTSKI